MSDDSSSYSDDYTAWTIHVKTTPTLPDEMFFIKNVYPEQTTGDFKKLICKIINRKTKNTKFYHEGEIMEDENTLSYYRKENNDDVCIQHAIVRPSKSTLVRWITSLS